MVNQPAQQKELLTEEEEMDVDIGAGIAAQMIYSKEGQKVVVKSLQSGDPVPGLAVFYAQLMEMVQTQSQKTDIPLSPRAWLVNGGILEESLDDVEKVAQMNGVDIDVNSMAAPLRDELVRILGVRSNQLQQQDQQGGETAAPTPSQPNNVAGVLGG